MKRTDTQTLILAMRVLARDVQCDDGVANSAIAEAADRLEELQNALENIVKNQESSFGNLAKHTAPWQIATEAIREKEATCLGGLSDEL